MSYAVVLFYSFWFTSAFLSFVEMYSFEMEEEVEGAAKEAIGGLTTICTAHNGCCRQPR